MHPRTDAILSLAILSHITYVYAIFTRQQQAADEKTSMPKWGTFFSNIETPCMSRNHCCRNFRGTHHPRPSIGPLSEKVGRLLSGGTSSCRTAFTSESGRRCFDRLSPKSIPGGLQNYQQMVIFRGQPAPERRTAYLILSGIFQV